MILPIPPPLRALAMLLTARAMDCPYIWHAHVALGREAGLSGALVNALRDRQTLPSVPTEEAAVIGYATELFQSRRVSPETFQAVLELLGSQGLVELTTLLGFYTMLAFNANAVELGLPEDMAEPPLPV